MNKWLNWLLIVLGGFVYYLFTGAGDNALLLIILLIYFDYHKRKLYK